MCSRRGSLRRAGGRRGGEALRGSPAGWFVAPAGPGPAPGRPATRPHGTFGTQIPSGRARALIRATLGAAQGKRSPLKTAPPPGPGGRQGQPRPPDQPQGTRTIVMGGAGQAPAQGFPRGGCSCAQRHSPGLQGGLERRHPGDFRPDRRATGLAPVPRRVVRASAAVRRPGGATEPRGLPTEPAAGTSPRADVRRPARRAPQDPPD